MWVYNAAQGKQLESVTNHLSCVHAVDMVSTLAIHTVASCMVLYYQLMHLLNQYLHSSTPVPDFTF